MSLIELDRVAQRVNHFIHARANPSGPQSGHTPNDSFQSLALDLFTLQYELVKAYRRFCDGRGASPANVHSWEQIPAMPTTGFKELELSALAPDSRTRVFLSSGTTEQRPSRHFHGPESLALYEASLWPWFESHLLPELRPCGAFPHHARSGGNGAGPQWLISLTPSPDSVPHSSLVHMFGVVAQRGSWTSTWLGRIDEDSGWCIDGRNASRVLEEATRGDVPVLLLGTAFSFVHLLDYLAEHQLRFQLPASSRVLETGGYKGRSRTLTKPELHRLIEQRLGVPASHLICEYGMSELSSQAYDRVCGGRQDGGCFRFPHWARARVISPETGTEVREGEVGLLQVVDLANVYSTVAIQTEDVAVRRGDGFELRGRSTQAEPRGCSLMATGSPP